MNVSVKTRAASNLFNVNKDMAKLTKKQHSCSITWWPNYYTYQEEQDKTSKWQWLSYVREYNHQTKTNTRN